MRTNNEYILRSVAGQELLIPTKSAAQQLNGMINLTESAAFIWKQVDSANDLSEIIRRLQEEYEVDEEVATRDVYGFLGELYMRGMIFDVPELEAIQKMVEETEQPE